MKMFVFMLMKNNELPLLLLTSLTLSGEQTFISQTKKDFFDTFSNEHLKNT